MNLRRDIGKSGYYRFSGLYWFYWLCCPAFQDFTGFLGFTGLAGIVFITFDAAIAPNEELAKKEKKRNASHLDLLAIPQVKTCS